MTARRASGRFLLRAPPELHCSLQRLAAERGLSLNALCVRLLAEGIGVEPALGSPVERSPWLELAGRFADACGGVVMGVVLFGSAVRGELRPSSDVDLLLVLAPDVPLRRRLYQIWDELLADVHYEHQVNAHFVHLPESVDEAGSLWLEVATEGRVVSDPRDDVSHWLIELRRAIASGRFVRRLAHGQPYWRRAA